MTTLPKQEILITFRHRYYKLEKPEFTTIRGKGKFKQLKIGQTVLVEMPGHSFTGRVGFAATVQGLELRRVRDMAIEFLKADAEYPGCCISTHQQFVNLLNSFRAPQWAQVTVDSEMTIITLRKAEIGKAESRNGKQGKNGNDGGEAAV